MGFFFVYLGKTKRTKEDKLNKNSRTILYAPLSHGTSETRSALRCLFRHRGWSWRSKIQHEHEQTPEGQTPQPVFQSLFSHIQNDTTSSLETECSCGGRTSSTSSNKQSLEQLNSKAWTPKPISRSQFRTTATRKHDTDLGISALPE